MMRPPMPIRVLQRGSFREGSRMRSLLKRLIETCEDIETPASLQLRLKPSHSSRSSAGMEMLRTIVGVAPRGLFGRPWSNVVNSLLLLRLSFGRSGFCLSLRSTHFYASLVTRKVVEGGD